jgi:anti-sigma factor RsiW
MTAAHPLPPEQVMAYLDGEVTADESREIEAHLVTCGACQQLAGDLRRGTDQMREWRIEEVPASLAAPAPRPRTASERSGWSRWTILRSLTWAGVSSRPLVLTAASVAVIAAVLWPLLRKPAPVLGLSVGDGASYESARAGEVPRAGGRIPASALRAQAPNVPDVPAPPAQAEPRIVRTATLRVVATDFDRIRPAVDRILRGAGGFVGGITAVDRPGDPRAIRGTLRVPSPQLDSVLSALRALGRVTEDSQGAEDVTATVVDLDVRIANSRITEKRLSQVLQNRTGGVSDVLEVEREIARVRTEIEQMEAQRKQLDQRIEYATLTLEIVEERAAQVNLGPVPVPTRLRHAIADGIESAAMSLLQAALFALRRGPAALLWIAVLGAPVWWLFRTRAMRVNQQRRGNDMS